MDPMPLASEVVADIPIVGAGLAGYAFATLHIPGISLLRATIATDIGAHCCPRDGATGSGDILTASATNLVAQNAANDGAGNRSGNVGVASIRNDLFALDPASLFGWTDHRVDRCDVRLVQSLLVATTVVVHGDRRRRVSMVIDAPVSTHRPDR